MEEKVSPVRDLIRDEDGFVYEIASSSGESLDDRMETQTLTNYSQDTLGAIDDCLKVLGLNDTRKKLKQETNDLKRDIPISDLLLVKDVHLQNAKLLRSVKDLYILAAEKEDAFEKVKQDNKKLSIQKNNHKIHFQRVEQEKQRLLKDLVRARKHCASYKPTFETLKSKYELMMKEKSLMRIERDRLAEKVVELEKNISNLLDDQLKAQSKETEGIIDQTSSKEVFSSSFKEYKDRNKKKINTRNWRSVIFSEQSSRVWDENKTNRISEDIGHLNPESLKVKHSFEAHAKAIGAIDYHHLRDFVLSAGDDGCLKIWTVDSGDLVLELQDCHESWISAAKFHPNPNSIFTCIIASCGGDNTVKIWDLKSCAHHLFSTTEEIPNEDKENKAESLKTFSATPIELLKDHTAAIWDAAWDSLGMKLLTASMDQTVKLFDCLTFQKRMTFRGHVDSVNSCNFNPINDNLVLTASADKTVSLWDARTGNCEVTLFGHESAIQAAKFNPVMPEQVASCDLNGAVCLWDIRKVDQLSETQSNYDENKNGRKTPFHCIEFDARGNYLIVGGDNGVIQIFKSEANRVEKDVEITGHQGQVNDIILSPGNNNLISAGADKCLKIWHI